MADHCSSAIMCKNHSYPPSYSRWKKKITVMTQEKKIKKLNQQTENRHSPKQRFKQGNRCTPVKAHETEPKKLNQQKQTGIYSKAEIENELYRRRLKTVFNPIEQPPADGDSAFLSPPPPPPPTLVLFYLK